MFHDPKTRRVRFMYTNYRGETRERIAAGPFHVAWEATDHHPTRQWILHCFDVQSGNQRSFAMAHMDDVRVVAEEDAYARCHDI